MRKITKKEEKNEKDNQNKEEKNEKDNQNKKKKFKKLDSGENGRSVKGYIYGSRYSLL